MSIAPVTSFPSAPSEHSEDAGVRSGTQARLAPELANEAVQSASGTLPKQQASAAKKISSTYDLPQDVVEVHQDPQIKDQIIVQYLDRSKNVILQVPSSGELSVQHGIAAESQQAAKLRGSETAEAESAGERTHGNKL